ncbi:MAG TPA: tetratricopeptide repeat protein, partial [Rhodothermales bacterium]|nr:tetratricopeptide repeat protein [Rhodothermales bacterium]
MVLAIVLSSTVTAQEQQTHRMAITTTSEEARALYLQARQYQEMSQPESARPLLEKALDLDPTFAMALDALRSVAPTFKASREVLARLQEVLETASLSEGEQLHFEALQAALAGDREHQREILESMVEQFPDDERIRYRLALFHFGNDDQQAAEILTEVTRLNPAFVPAYNTLGYSLRSLGREEDAERAFQTAIDLNPDNPNAYDSYAELLLSQGRHEASIAYYEETLAREPLFPSAQIGVAANLILLNRHAEARRRLDTLFQIAPHDGIRSGVHWAKAVTYVDEGHMDLALAELEKNLALSQKADDRAAVALDLTNIATC